jgi:hypothetical protein
MRTGTSGVVSMRHVGLVALEALLVAVIVWIAAMTLAGATQNGGIIGTTNAEISVSLTVSTARLGGTAVVTAEPGDDGMWIRATCVRSSTTVLSQWIRIAKHRAVVDLARTATWSSGAADCMAEQGYFASNGRWRVIDTTAFVVGG